MRRAEGEAANPNPNPKCVGRRARPLPVTRLSDEALLDR